MFNLRQSTASLIGTVLASLALLLVLVNSWLILSNESIRGEVGVRQQFINQSIQMSRMNQELINALVNAAVRNNNTALRDLLAQNGITIASNPQGQPQAQPAPAPGPAATPAPAPAARPSQAPEAPPDKPPVRK